MSVIKRLDTVIANKIAAGEVIEKIGNVVKELVENSIDAASQKIDIDLLESGLKSITVTDNGTGMDAFDAVLAFERHATSKISNVNDLFRINSLGFRGEALPSIASISRVEMITSTGDAGIKVVYEDGKFIEKTDVSSNKGTQINVTKLFYTTPARFKYLKSPQYELAIIQSMINRFAFAYPNISFRLTNNNKLMFISPGNQNIVDIIANIYSTEIARQMIAFSKDSRDYKIHGMTSNPIINRSSRNYINIFVNQRAITDTKIIRVIKECYDQLIPKNRYPVTILYIECDPSIIDVNIHPRKQEIKFSEYEKLLTVIKEAISEKITQQSIYQTTKPKDFQQEKMTFHEATTSYNLETEKTNEQQVDIEAQVKTEKRIIPDIEYIGQYSGTYLLFQNENGLFLLDQHAAAERIRYERYLHNMTSTIGERPMLVPLKLHLSNTITLRLADYLDDLTHFGIHVKIVENEILIYQVPLWFPENYELMYSEAVIMKLTTMHHLDNQSIIDDLAKLLACKHSLKANHYITKMEANQLVIDLRKCLKPYTCPHGRPIIVTISIDQIERLFNRVM